MKKFLIIQLYRLGDNLQVTPLITGLREKHPESYIAILTENTFESVFRKNNDLDEIFLFHRSRYEQQGFRDFNVSQIKVDEVVNSLKAKNFDLIINRTSNDEGAILAFLIRAKETIGFQYNNEKNHFISDKWTTVLSHAVKNRKVNPFNLVDYNIYIGNAIPRERSLKIFNNKEDAYNLKIPGLTNKDNLIAMLPGSSKKMKRWHENNFTQLSEMILKSSESKILFLGSPEDKSIVKKIIRSIDPTLQRRVFDLTEHVTLELLPSILSICNLLITNDSGPMHYAAAVGCPMIALFFASYYHYEVAPYCSHSYIIHANVDCFPCKDPSECKVKFACKTIIKAKHIFALYNYIANNNSNSFNIDKEIMIYTSGIRDKQDDIVYYPLIKKDISFDEFSRIVYGPFLKYILLNESIKYETIVQHIVNHYFFQKIFDYNEINFNFLRDLFENDPSHYENSRIFIKEMVNKIKGLLNT